MFNDACGISYNGITIMILNDTNNDNGTSKNGNNDDDNDDDDDDDDDCSDGDNPRWKWEISRTWWSEWESY